MESEKVMYWMTLGVLALATIDRIRRLSTGDGATALWTARSRWCRRPLVWPRTMPKWRTWCWDARKMTCQIRAGLVNVQDDVQDDVQNEVQARLACAQRTLVRGRLNWSVCRPSRVQVRVLERVPRTIVLPARNIVIEIPQPPEIAPH